MEQYIIIKSFGMLMAVVGAFSFFLIRVRRLYHLMLAVEGASEFKLDRLAQRFKILITDVLGQANVRRKLLPGLAHTLIFFGFLAVQPHSLELMVKGIWPAFEFGQRIPVLYGGYLFTADILAALVLVGFAYAIYRRLLLKPAYLTLGRDANLIILFTCLIIITFQLINALATLLPLAPGAFDYRGWLPVSVLWIDFLGMDAWSSRLVTVSYETAYWIHMATILGFLVYIPGSKHLHLLAAAPNVFLKPLTREKAIAKSDLENEELETFGLGKVSELNWKNVLNLYACTECGRCEEQCPASQTGKPLSPKALIHDFKSDLLVHADAILGGSPERVRPLVRANAPITGDVLWSCTTCRACEEACPVNIEHLDFIVEARKHQVLMEASFPPEIQETFSNLENQANPWGFGADTRAQWCRDLEVPLMSDNPEADLLWFVGCAGSFDDRGKKISRALARVLQRAGVNFAILGPEEACNGDMARRAGNEYLAQMLIQQNAETLNGYRPKRILASCPHCFNIIRNEYPRFDACYPVVHHTQFLFELMAQGKLPINGKHSGGTLTYHDSCYLGRWNGIYDAPRELLRAATGGAGPLELKQTRDRGFCCGAGGARMFMEETIGTRINGQRTREIVAAGVKTVATACPFCTTMLRDGVMDSAADIDIKDIVEIIDEGLG